MDKDDDGMADSWETANGFKPADPNDAWLDADGDKVLNLFEYQLGSDPRSIATPPVVTVGPTGATYAKLEDAIYSSAQGSCIRVAGGKYSFNYTRTYINRVFMIQGGWSPDFKVRNLKTYQTVLDGSGKNNIFYLSFSAGNHTVILDGLKMVNVSSSFSAVTVGISSSVGFFKASLFNCQIVKNTSAYGAGLKCFGMSGGLMDLTIANTIIAGNSASGITFEFSDSAKGRWRILHSVVAKNKGGSVGNGYGIDGFTQRSGSLETHIFNSIIWGNTKEDIWIRYEGLTFNVDHTDLGKAKAYGGAKCILGAGNLNKDPKFASVSKADYHLKSASPAINKGIKKGMPAVDFEGDKRVKGAAPDMGADEVK